VEEILREGPPFAINRTSLERHEVYLGDDELVFMFEGPGAGEIATGLFAEPGVLGRVLRIGEYLAGEASLPREVFSWRRPRQLEGVVFAPTPGPGDSDGG
jgi:hypothetical protein